MQDMTSLRNKWNQATSELPWGVQRVLYDTLNLVAEGKVTLVHGTDYSNGSPCLINAVGQMLTSGGGRGIPTQYFGNLVSLFDRINREFMSVPGHNTDSKVSPAVAEVLVHWFAPLKDEPIPGTEDEAAAMEVFASQSYIEPSDADMMSDWLLAVSQEAPTTDELRTEQRA